MSIKIIDAHTHIQMIDSIQQEAVIKRAFDGGIGIINAGADEKSSCDAVDLARKYSEGMWATVGYHPQEVDKKLNTELLEKLAQDKRVVGIGECGLEYFKLDLEHEGEIKKKQRELFEFHIQLAREVQKPLVIHCREAFADMIAILQNNREKLLSNAGIVHFFTGTIDDARALLDLGFSFTVGGLITFNRSLDNVIKSIPLEKILVETDAPWVVPLSYKKNGFLKNKHGATINEPVYITETIEWLAKIKNISQEEMESVVLENTQKIFKIDFV